MFNGTPGHLEAFLFRDWFLPIFSFPVKCNTSHVSYWAFAATLSPPLFTTCFCCSIVAAFLASCPSFPFLCAIYVIYCSVFSVTKKTSCVVHYLWRSHTFRHKAVVGQFKNIVLWNLKEIQRIKKIFIIKSKISLWYTHYITIQFCQKYHFMQYSEIINPGRKGKNAWSIFL